MKKIIAGVLAAASVLSVSATAFATSNTKAVSKAGEVNYDVAATAPKIVLDLVMPAKMSASLNPYGAEINVGVADVAAKDGIISTFYTVTNKTKDYGVYLDATATTTVSTSDKDADGKPTWSVKTVESGKKSASLAFVTVKGDETPTVDSTTKLLKNIPTSDTAMSTSSVKYGALLMDSTKAADTENKIPAGQTSLKKVGFVPAKDTEDGKLYLAFVGKLETADTIEWKEDDAINVNLVLKVVAGPKTLPSS